jgi:DNA-binding winged helix-turn-helix (wHTH) protein
MAAIATKPNFHTATRGEPISTASFDVAAPSPGLRLRFGSFELDPKSGELTGADGTVVLQWQPLRLLLMLIECGGEMVTREEIQKRLWSDDVIVDFDHSINQLVRKVRRVLGDSAEAPNYIETLARRGYRLKVAVETIERPKANPARHFSRYRQRAFQHAEEHHASLAPLVRTVAAQSLCDYLSSASPAEKLDALRQLLALLTQVLEGPPICDNSAFECKVERSIQSDEVIPIVMEALYLPPKERQVYLHAVFDGNEHLRSEVLEALHWEERMGSFLTTPFVNFECLSRPFESGQVVADRFEIVREIGEGGMGVVYEAFDRKLQEQCAIKAAKPGFQRLLSPELKAALKVRHHNVCLIKEIHTAQTDFGEIDFLTMELLNGQTLSAYLATVGKIRQEEAVDIACQICAGLAEAHHRGIVHRDLKSGNIMLCDDVDGSQRAVITDFGLAGEPTSYPRETAGTPAYMAPELWRGDKASRASDIYALGVILYEMVAGRKPYDLDDEGSAKESLSEQAPPQWLTERLRRYREIATPSPSPSKWTPNLDSRWDSAILNCLAIAPGERIQDASEVVAALKGQEWDRCTRGLGWCREGDLNSHNPFGSADFRSKLERA